MTRLRSSNTLPRMARRKKDPPSAGSAELIRLSRLHLKNAAVETLLATQTFVEAWMTLWEGKSATIPPRWIGFARRVLAETAKVAKSDRNADPHILLGDVLDEVSRLVEEEQASAASAEDPRAQAYVETLVAVRRLLVAARRSGEAPMRGAPAPPPRTIRVR